MNDPRIKELWSSWGSKSCGSNYTICRRAMDEILQRIQQSGDENIPLIIETWKNNSSKTSGHKYVIRRNVMDKILILIGV